MSLRSIGQNNDAIITMQEAIDIYDGIISEINLKNKNNKKTNEIVSVMNSNIIALKDAIAKTRSLNSRMRTALSTLKDEEK